MSYVALATHATAAALAAGLTWGFLDARHAAEVGEIRVGQADAQLAAVITARGEERVISKNYQEALNAARNRQAKLADYNRRAGLAAERLRDQLREADVRIASAADAAVREYAATANAVLGQCVSRYRAMGQAAAGHADDARTCREAWPVTATPAP